jgi:hypothetical protein
MITSQTGAKAASAKNLKFMLVATLGKTYGIFLRFLVRVKWGLLGR